MKLLTIAALMAAIFILYPVRIYAQEDDTEQSVGNAEDEGYKTVTVRVTFYTLRGCMASSNKACNYTHSYAAACSRHYPFGTQLRFPDGYVVTCEDRGHGDWYWSEWVDIWAPTYTWGINNVEANYGIYTTVSIIRWGWGE
jgi:hypothetical protein